MTGITARLRGLPPIILPSWNSRFCARIVAPESSKQSLTHACMPQTSHAKRHQFQRRCFVAASGTSSPRSRRMMLPATLSGYPISRKVRSPSRKDRYACVWVMEYQDFCPKPNFWHSLATEPQVETLSAVRFSDCRRPSTNRSGTGTVQ